MAIRDVYDHATHTETTDTPPHAAVSANVLLRATRGPYMTYVIVTPPTLVSIEVTTGGRVEKIDTITQYTPVVIDESSSVVCVSGPTVSKRALFQPSAG